APQLVDPFWVPAPVTATVMVPLSPETVLQAPPTDVTVTLVEYGKVRATPFTCVSVTTGAVWSIVTVWAPLVPVLPALSACVAVTEYTPAVESAGAAVYAHAPEAHAVVPFCVAAPVIAILTVGLSPAEVPHAPPSDVTARLVEYGNVRAVP